MEPDIGPGNAELNVRSASRDLIIRTENDISVDWVEPIRGRKGDVAGEVHSGLASRRDNAPSR